MSAFWIAAAAMVIAATALALLPLYWARPQTNTSRQALNTRLFRERLSELDEEHREQRIDRRQYLDLRADLERTLLADSPANGGVRRSRGAGWLAGGVAVSVPLLACAYYYFSAYRGETEQWLALQDRLQTVVALALQNPSALPDEAYRNLPDFTRALQARVLREGKRNPDSLFLLGLSFSQLQLPEQARELLAHAHRLAPARSDIMAAYAQARIMSHQGKLDAESARLLQAVLRSNPQHQGALMMLGFGAFNSGDYETALRAWRPLLDSLPGDSQAARLLQESIDRAERALDAPEQADGAVRIAVTVDLTPELQARLQADDTLFVFAKAVQGPPMPLAAIRQAARDFPVRVILDDNRSMLPSLKLSNFEDVIVGARVSKGGGPGAQPGDWEGSSEPLNLADGPLSVSLTIDKVVQ